MYIKVDVLYDVKYEHILSVGEAKQEVLGSGVTRVTGIAFKTLGSSHTSHIFTVPVREDSYVVATRKAIDVFQGSPESRSKTTYIKDIPPREWESWDSTVTAVDLYDDSGGPPFRFGANEDVQPEWWAQVKPMARKRGNITGGGVRINLNLTGGRPMATPIPMPPLPEAPISDEERHRIFCEVANPFRWKNPTIAKWVPTFIEALKYANAIRYHCGGAEIWALPTGYQYPGYVVTSLGYWHYIGS